MTKLGVGFLFLSLSFSSWGQLAKKIISCKVKLKNQEEAMVVLYEGQEGHVEVRKKRCQFKTLAPNLVPRRREIYIGTKRDRCHSVYSSKIRLNPEGFVAIGKDRKGYFGKVNLFVSEVVLTCSPLEIHQEKFVQQYLKSM